MVPLDRALVSSYRLSVVTMSLTAAVWPQFATEKYRLHRLHVCRINYLFTVTGSSVQSTGRYDPLRLYIGLSLVRSWSK